MPSVPIGVVALAWFVGALVVRTVIASLVGVL
jgi:hypothetical protein